MTPARKRGRPSKAAAAAANLGSWDRSAPARRPKATRKGRPSARTLAARTLAERRNKSLTPEARAAIAAAGGRAAAHPKKLTDCPHCRKPFGARDMRKHLPACPARPLDRIRTRRKR